MMLRVKEPFNGFSHLAGALLSVLGLVVLVTMAALNASAWHIVSFSIYGAAMILLYSASALYHLLPLGEKGTAIFRTLDHVMIYLLIAGTYTPICLVPLRGAWGWSLFGVIWGLAFGGIVFEVFRINAPRWLTTGIYLAMGWASLVAIHPLIKNMPSQGLLWMGLGGFFYTLGAVIYALKKPDPWPGKFGFHEIWHIFVLGGSFCHFFMMYSGILQIG